MVGSQCPFVLDVFCVLQFVETNKEALAELPPPMAAAAYYRNEDLYMVRQAAVDRAVLRSQRWPHVAAGCLHRLELLCPALPS
jgi:hypothetical protein